MTFVADLTFAWGWGPKDAMGLTWSECLMWNAQAVRIYKERKRPLGNL